MPRARGMKKTRGHLRMLHTHGGTRSHTLLLDRPWCNSPMMMMMMEFTSTLLHHWCGWVALIWSGGVAALTGTYAE
jgi:hypothetical protein